MCCACGGGTDYTGDYWIEKEKREDTERKREETERKREETLTRLLTCQDTNRLSKDTANDGCDWYSMMLREN